MKNTARLILISILMGWSNLILAAALPEAKVQQIDITDSLGFTGIVEAINSGTASSQTSGRVIETLVDVGDLVEKDAVLLKLRDTHQRANYESAQAEVKAAQAVYESSQKEYQRVSNILKRKLVSQSTADQALAQRDRAKAVLEASQARLNDALEELEYTTVKAPYSGIVTERHVEVGEAVNVGTPLYSGMSLESLRVVAAVPQKDLDSIRANKTAIVELPDGKQLTIQGDAFTFYASADPKTTSFKVRVNLPEHYQGLYPGMYLKTLFNIGTKKALVVPVEGIIHRGELTAIYVKMADRLEFRQIRVGQSINGNLIEILSGLSEGETVITSPDLAIRFLQSQFNKNGS